MALVLWTVSSRWSSTSRGDATASIANGDSVVQQFAPGSRVSVEPFTAELLDGAVHDSTTLTRRVAVYNVWGSWCGPCRVEAPALSRLARETAGTVAFTGINVRDGLDAALAFERANQVPYPSIRSADSAEALLAFGASIGVTAVPTTLVLDTSGRVAARVVGPTSYRTLRALIDDATAEDPAGPASPAPGS